MSTFTAILTPSPDGTLHLPVPEEWRHQAIRVTAELEPLPVNRPRAKEGSWTGFGGLKGKVWMSPDSDEPLEDFKEHME